MSADRQSADCSIPVADVAREFLHTTGTLSYPTTQLSGRTGSTQSHFPQVRFWTTSSTVYNGWERYRPLSFTICLGKRGGKFLVHLPEETTSVPSGRV